MTPRVLSFTALALILPQLALAKSPATATPIEHVIVILGENRTFDQIFATYMPRHGQEISNLLSKKIVNQDGSPGPNFAEAAQYWAQLHGTYDPSPTEKTAYKFLPPAMTDQAPGFASDTKGPPFVSLAVAKAAGEALPEDAVPLLLTGATGLKNDSIDTRFPNATKLPDGPYPLTPTLSYDDYTANPVHRFFEMWQQMDCGIRHASAANPSGCLLDLLPWVEVSTNVLSNGKKQPKGFNDLSTGEGSAAMGFYNMARGDAPYLKQLADAYTIADNYHQAVLGGTGANHVAIGTGDAIWYSDGNGNAVIPPKNQIENPNPQPGTDNYYTQDGYKGGSYSDCADPAQPGVKPIRDYLASLPYRPDPKCEKGHYYLLNNYAPGYLGDGTLDHESPFVIPPSNLPTIGDALLERGISWGYFGEGWNAYLKNPKSWHYCNICDPFQYVSSIMTRPAVRQAHLKDLTDFYDGLGKGQLPAVAYVKPSGLNDGHPATSKLDLFEAFCRKLIAVVQKHPKLWRHTAILVTFDEGGGYYDSGYVQPLDFFGDGPRIPLIIVSPYSRGGLVAHSYTDHVSILKFIERNWNLPPLTRRSRDNLPNPVASTASAYIPANPPAIGDLTDMFRFPGEKR